MKIPSLLVALLVSASTTVNAESTCSEESGVCICSGSCPSFTSGWDITAIGDNCIANISEDKDINVGGMSDGDVITVNDIEYTYPFDACPGSANGVGGETSPGTITVGSWLVGGAAILAATVVGW